MLKALKGVIGFTTTRGLLLDLDNMTEKKTVRLCGSLCSRHKLEGFIILKSSNNHYHAVFNRYLSWKKALMIASSIFKCVEWVIWQVRKGEFTLRISTKHGINKPQIVFEYGRKDKLIRDYLEIYGLFKDY